MKGAGFASFAKEKPTEQASKANTRINRRIRPPVFKTRNSAKNYNPLRKQKSTTKYSEYPKCPKVLKAYQK
jgi:hypothetical protein